MAARDEADGPTVVLTAPIARKRKEMDSSTQILFFFSFSPGSQPGTAHLYQPMKKFSHRHATRLSSMVILNLIKQMLQINQH